MKELPSKEASLSRTRLVVSGYWACRPRWLQALLSLFVLEPAHWVMQKRQFDNLKRLAEWAATGGTGLPGGINRTGR